MASSSKSTLLIGGSLVAGAAVGYVYSVGIQPDVAMAAGVGGIAALLAAGVAAMRGVSDRVEEVLKGREQETTDLAREFSESLNNVMKQTREQLGQVQESLAATVKSLDSGLSENGKQLEAAVSSLGSELSTASSNWGEGLGKLFNDQLKSQEAATAALQKAVEGWNSSVNTALGDHAKRLEEVAGQLSGQSSSGGEELRKSMETASGELAATFTAGGEELRKTMEAATKTVSESMKVAAKDLGDKVESVNKLATNVDSVLQVSKATDQALNSLTAAGDFKETLSAFRDHMAESDRLLREAAKPKQFQLMESFGEEIAEES